MATNGENGEGRDSAQDDSIRSLISSVTSDAQSLLKAQAELTQVELKQTASQAGGVGAMFVGALLFAGMAGIFILITLAYVLVALGLPVWAGFGIVALVLVVVAVTLLIP